MVSEHSFKYVKFIHDSNGVAHLLLQDNDQFLSSNYDSRVYLHAQAYKSRSWTWTCDRMWGYAIGLVGVQEMLTKISLFTASIWFIVDLISL